MNSQRFQFTIRLAQLTITLCLFLILINGCQTKGTAILPIPPNDEYNNQTNRIQPPDSFEEKGNCGKGKDPRIIRTGPIEYFNSKLSTPIISENMPTFSAVLVDYYGDFDGSHFKAYIDDEYVPCSVISNEIQFFPIQPLKNGKHIAELKFENPDGLIRKRFWEFNVNTTPPKITAILLLDNEDAFMVFFNREIEPYLLTDPKRWSLNGESSYTTNDIEDVYGNMIVKIKINKTRHGSINGNNPLSISFNDINGTAEFQAKPNIGERELCSVCLNCDTNPPSMTFENNEHTVHEPLETEYPAFAFSLHRPNCISAQMESWSLTPINNLRPYPQGTYNQQEGQTAYNLNFDPLTTGPPIDCSGQFFPSLYEGIQTISLPRCYLHSFVLNFTAFCDVPATLELGSISLTLGEEHLDIANPEFVQQPEIIYGWEIPSKVGGWLDGVPGKNTTPYGPKRIWTHSLPDLYTFLNFYANDINSKCALYIVAEIKDTVPNERNGYINLNKCFLDKALKSGDIVFDMYETNDHYEGIGLDYHPWGCAVPNIPVAADDEDYELVSWDDPVYPRNADYEPGIIGEDWNPSEGEIIIIKLPDLENGGGNNEIVEIKVRLEDIGFDPTGETYRANWIRSVDVLSQLRFQSVEAHAKFINDNPYDDDPNWKIVKYDDNINTDNSRETTFIYNRAEDGLNDGRVRLDYYILLDSNEHVNPLIPIEVKFSSTESRFPSGCDQNVTLNAYQTNGADIPGGIIRLNELFTPASECPQYYHTWVSVTENQMTSPEYHTLFVSSRDYFLEGDDIMDFTTSIGESNLPSDEFDNFSFGTKRSQGYDFPIKNEKQWYPYDEFIINGGMEIVEANIVTPNILLEPNNYEYQYVPVQSESDVILISAHCGLKHDDIYSTQTYPYPNNVYNSIKSVKWLENAWQFNVNNLDATFCFGNSRCSDFSSEPDAGWYDFWLKEGGELRWLALSACFSMQKTTPVDIRQNWKVIIGDNYVSSVCGFRDVVYPCKSFNTFYGKFLTKLYKQVDGYESTTEVCIPGHEVYYILKDGEDWRDNASKDLSVAAWMESAAFGLYSWKYRKTWVGRNIWAAAAVNDETYHTDYFYFYLKPIKTPKNPSSLPSERHNCRHVIRKVSL